MKKVLVTGGSGFIGSNLGERLSQEPDVLVSVVDDLSNGYRDFTPANAIHYMCDFSHSSILASVANGNYECVFHCAALPRVSYSVEHPLQTHETNVTKTLKLLDACAKSKTKFVFSSSSSVYGGADRLPTPIWEKTNPKSPYALQKFQIEQYMRLYGELYGLDSVALRYFNVFGKNQLGGSPYSTAVSAWLSAIYNGVALRSDGDGTQSRDMCHVDNVVEANYLAWKSDKKFAGRAFNVACGDSVTNNQILNHLIKRYYPTVQVNHAPWRAGDVMHTLADITETKLELGYEVKVRFWEGLEKTIDWFESTPIAKARTNV
jgi:UDP-glucose 4-epimerase